MVFNSLFVVLLVACKPVGVEATTSERVTQGVDSTYNVRVGRSDAITGPYVDREAFR